MIAHDSRPNLAPRPVNFFRGCFFIIFFHQIIIKKIIQKSKLFSQIIQKFIQNYREPKCRHCIIKIFGNNFQILHFLA